MREVAKPYFYRGMRFSFHASLLSVTKYSDYTNSSHCFTDLPLIRVPRQRGTWRVVVKKKQPLIRVVPCKKTEKNEKQKGRGFSTSSTDRGRSYSYKGIQLISSAEVSGVA